MPTDLSKQTHLLLWLDFETTGNIAHGVPIEVGAMITDWNYRPVGNTFHSLIAMPEMYNPGFILPVVQAMHTENGLWYDLQNTPNVPNFRVVDQNLMRWILEITELYEKEVQPLDTITVELAGSGVSHFDTEFLRLFFRETWDLVKGYDSYHKPTCDLGVIRRFFNRMELEELKAPDFFEEEGLRPHRALDDVKNFILQAQWYRDRLEEIRDFAYSHASLARKEKE